MSLLDKIVGSPSDPASSSPDPRRALLPVAAVAVVLAVAAYAANLLSALLTVAVIAAVIMAHEAGHFVAAKLSGMKVTEYFLGFGPRLWSVKKGETEYGIKALPLGGYVRIVGMNNLDVVDPADEPRTYRQQSFPRRLAVAVAGSSVHFMLALIAAWSLFAFANQAKVKPVIAAVPPISGSVSPAERAGLDAGDRIISYDGIPTNGSWDAVHVYIQHHIDVPVTFVVQRQRGGHTQQLTITATPADGTTLLDHGQPLGTDHVGVLGVTMAATNESLLGSIPHAFTTFWQAGVVDTVHGLGQIFSPHGLASIGHQVASSPGSSTTDPNAPRPSSVVGIVQIAGQLHGWPAKVALFMVANAFVGLINLFPILPFDGGHVLIAVYEAIRSRRGRRYFADVNKMLPYAFVVIVVIGFVFVSSLYLDIFHPVTLH